MAEASFYHTTLGILRRWKVLYRFLSALRRGTGRMFLQIARRVLRNDRHGPAQGFFSGLVSLEATGELIQGGQILIPAGADSLRIRCSMNQNGRQPWPIFWRHFPNARLVGPTLAVMNADRRLLSEAVYGPEFQESDPSYNYFRLPKALHLQGNWTSIVSRWDSGYYHWLTDCLPRLALLEKFPPDCRVLVRGPLKKYQRDSLEMLGILDRCRQTPENHLTIENYYFSAPTAMTGCDNPHAVEFLRSHYLPFGKSDVRGPQKIFIQRNGKTRGILNQNELIKFFTDLGWGIVDLENISFRDQIALFSKATHIVGEHGAAFTNVVWCSEGCRILELCADNFLNGCYEGIAISVGVRHYHKVFAANSRNEFYVPIKVLMEEIGENLID